MVQNTKLKENITLRLKPIVSVLLTLAGILIGLLLSLLAVWGDYESTSYGFMKRANAPLHGLSCPMFLGKDETGTVSIKVSNPTDHSVSAGVRTEISTSHDPVSNLEFVQLAAGAHSQLQRTVGPQNIDLGSFIFVNASVFSIYPSPDREGTCGIFVLPVATGSSSLSILGATLSVLFMSIGSLSLYKNESRTHRSRALLFMVLMTLLAMIFCFMGWWVQPLFLIIVAILTFLISLGSLF